MRRIMCMVALGLALLGTGRAAFAQNVHTGSDENERSGYGNSYNSGPY